MWMVNCLRGSWLQCGQNWFRGLPKPDRAERNAMYTTRIQLANYGPIENLDIEFPFEGESPKPVVLVGENGSGKSILLSHIVNGLIVAKGCAFPESPEVEVDKVYKLRSTSYIKTGSEYFFGRVDFEGGFFVSEVRARRNKEEYAETPEGIPGTAPEAMWGEITSEENDRFDSNFVNDPSTTRRIRAVFAKNCILYFPFNRFEEPAWLNEENLNAEARHLDLRDREGQTSRRVISYSPLHDNQDWLFGVVFDRAAFELQTLNVNFPANQGQTTIPLTVFSGYSGDATRTYETALSIVQTIMNKGDARFGIGKRNNRIVSIESATGGIVPNIFQLSSGESSLLNIFLSILRDFGLSGSQFAKADDIRGIVVVDEVDLHLHAVHQHEVLPQLIGMFPNVQFIVTTHSPLFVLGMQRGFGDNGFGLYRLPHGRQISSEEFTEFGDAYDAFIETKKFSNDMRAAIEKSQRPIVFVEGTTDLMYIQRASTLLGKDGVLEGLELRDGEGSGNLAKIWKDSLLPLTETLPQRVLLLFDCDSLKSPTSKGKLFQRSIPQQVQNPIGKGIENLFSKPTLDMARKHEPGFFTTEEEHGGTDKEGQPITIPEKWTISDGQKTNLCVWLCENGTTEDFQHFQLIFALMEEVLDSTSADAAGAESEAVH